MKVRNQPVIRNQDSNAVLKEKDLGISYLHKYQSNAYHEINREQTKNALKDITDKYGFVWDEMGRLSKTKTNPHKPVPQPYSREVQETRHNKSTNKQNKQAHYQNELHPSEYLKSQINNINQRINRIVNKYKPQTQVESETSKLDDFCQCHHKNRIVTESDPIESPYFPTKCTLNVTINRSKSVSYLTKPHPRISQDSLEKSGLSSNKVIGRHRKTEQNNRDTSPETKVIDTQIDRINKRIKECEKQKEKLAIDFKKYEFRGKSKTPEKSRIIEQQDRSPFKKIQKQELPNELLNISITNQQIMERKTKDRQKLLGTYKDGLGNNQDQLVKNPSKNVTVSGKKQNCIRRSENKGIISKFCRQIELDEQFRNAKLWFENNEDPHKWGIIADKLALEGKPMKYRELVEKFSCAPEEHNPFFSIKNNYESYASLLSVYKEDERHWMEQIENKISPLQLEMEQFTGEELDVEGKGGVRVQDFVRYINMRTKNFYRTRDLLLIFQRFAGRQKKEVHFSRVLQTLIP